MTSIVALGAVTGGIDLPASEAELREFGFEVGSYTEVSSERMEAFRAALEKRRGRLPQINSGGSVANTADLLARAGLSCGFIGLGGDDTFGRIFISNFERASLKFLSQLQPGAITGYDFYLYSQNNLRTIILTHGANALLSPAHIDTEAIQGADLLLLDGGALDFGPESKAAVLHCLQAAEEADVPFVLTLASAEVVEGHRTFFDTFGPKAQIVAGNLAQTAVLLDLKPEASLDQVRTALARHSLNAVVTLDAAGAFARFSDEEFLLPTRKIKAVDSTGAGDNFLAAFLVARMKGLSVPKALAVGNIVAGKVIQYHGARLPVNVDVPGLMQETIDFAETLAE